MRLSASHIHVLPSFLRPRSAGWLLLGLLLVQVFVPVQAQHVPDTVSLSDVRFFRDKVAGQLFNDALEVPSQEGVRRYEMLKAALAHAQQTKDYEAQGLVRTEIALYHLSVGQISDAFDCVNQSISIDSLLPRLSPLRQRMHRTIAGIYVEMEAHQLAIPHWHIALAIDVEREAKSTPRRFRHSSSLAGCYQNSGQMDSAFYYYHKSIAIAQELHAPLWHASGLNNLGMAQQAMHRLPEALATYQKAFAILDPQRYPELEFAMSVRDNWGSALLELGRPEEAIGLFRQNWEDTISMAKQFPRAQAGLRLVQTLVALGEGAAAARQLAELKDFVRGAQPDVGTRYHKDLLLASIAVANANRAWENSAALQSDLLRYQDSLRRNSYLVKLGALQDMLLDKTAHFRTELALKEEASRISQSRARTQIFLILSLALLSVVMLGLLIIYSRRRTERIQARHKEETYRREMAELNLKNQRLENAQLSQELEMKKRDITDYALVYSLRRKVLEEVLEDLRQIKRAPNPEKSVQELIITLRGKIEGQDRTHLESENIELVNHAFFEKLKQAFPILSSSELELCGMIRLGYSAKDVASLRNIAPASVRIAKTRLKKKMNLGQETDLRAFLEAF